MWFLFALGSAVFAALTSILAKVGIEGVDSNLATAIRTAVVLALAWGMVFLTGAQKGIQGIGPKSWLFLILSGLATGASWLCYYHALQIGAASKVVPVDKLSVVITLVLAIMSGYALSRFKIAWNRWIVAAFLSAQMFPIISRMISLYDLLGKIHLINTRAGLILALTAAMLPFTITLMASFFDGIPRELEEAAIVDGAGRIQTLLRIIMPLVKSGMVAVGIYAFLMTWDDYLHAVTLIQNDSLRTLSAGVALRYLGELSYDWSKVNTISVVGILPIMLIFFFFQKYMIKGLVAGAVKG